VLFPLAPYHNPEGKVAMKVGYARFFLCPFQRDSQETGQGLMSDYVVEKVQGFVESFLPSMGLELVEIQYRQESMGWVLRLFIDGPDGIGVDQCARVSRELNTFLEVEDLIQHAYSLEVSSPGLERPLRSSADFKRYAGKKARIKLRHPIEDKKVFIGLVGESDEKEVELLFDDGTSSRFLMENIRKARLSL
jgi:ribosome maturation factor RimP